MAQYFLSQDPTIQNFGASKTTEDTFVINTTSDSLLSINQEGTNVVVTDGTDTATFLNFAIEQLSSSTNNQTILNTFDGSNIIIGTASSDYIDNSYSTTNDYLSGLAGNDTIFAGTGNDLIYGNQGDDTIFSGATPRTFSTGNDTIFGGQGDDVIELSSESRGNNIIYGDLGNDILFSGSGNDALYGGQGSDELESFGASSTMSGGLGDDLIDAFVFNASSTNLIYGNQGDDQITGFGLKDTVYGGQGNDFINYDDAANGKMFGPASGALIYGNQGNDVITGSTAGDTLYGDQGDDIIVGNVNGLTNNGVNTVSGHDVMTGGAGTNTFVQTAATTGNTDATADVITDFVSGKDKIEGSTPGTSTNFSIILANGQLAKSVVTHAAGAAAVGGGGNTYTFVVGKSDGYLVETDAAGNVGVTTLTGDNSITSLKASDIIAGADTVPGGGTIA